MWRFYLDILGRMVASLKRTAYAVEGAFGVIVFLLVLANRPLAQRVSNFDGINPNWAWLAIGLVFSHLFLKSIYEKHKDIEQAHDNERAALAEEIAGLRNTANTESSRAEIRFALSNALINCSQYIRQVSGRESQPNVQAIYDWHSNLETYLLSLDAQFVARLKNPTGLNFPDMSDTDAGRRPLLIKLWIAATRLEQFIKEFS